MVYVIKPVQIVGISITMWVGCPRNIVVEWYVVQHDMQTYYSLRSRKQYHNHWSETAHTWFIDVYHTFYIRLTIGNMVLYFLNLAHLLVIQRMKCEYTAVKTLYFFVTLFGITKGDVSNVTISTTSTRNKVAL